MHKVLLTLLGPGSKGLPRVLCTTQTLFCTGATPISHQCKRPLARGVQKTFFALSPNRFRELSLFGRFPRNASDFKFANPSALCRAQKTPKMGKTPISPHPREGRFESKIPICAQGSTGKMGIFLTRNAFSWVGGNGGFSTQKPSFPNFGVFDPCTGQTDR